MRASSNINKLGFHVTMIVSRVGLKAQYATIGIPDRKQQKTVFSPKRTCFMRRINMADLANILTTPFFNFFEFYAKRRLKHCLLSNVNVT